MNQVEKAAAAKAAGGRRPGRQRSRAVDQAILTAATEILAEEGYGAFTMQKVIARAGVSSATLYRRWASADDLVLAALRSIETEPVAIDTGSLDGDLEAFIAYLAQALDKLEDIAIAEASGPRAPEELRRQVAKMFSRPRLAMLGAMLQRAQQRGELQTLPPLDLCWTYVISPIHYWLYLRGEPLTEEFVASTRVLLGAGLRALAKQKTGAKAAPKRHRG